MGCHHLEEVTIPEGITSIGKDSFSEAGNSILLIPNTVTSISKEALNSSWGLSVIRFTGSKEEWDKLGLTSSNIHNATVYYNYDPNHEHSYEPHIIEASTCTEKGLQKMICSLCGDSYNEEIPAAGHKAVIDEAVAPTCEESGKTEGSHCSVCNEVLKEQEDVPPAGHTVVKDEAIEATCEENGKTEGSHCSVCGKILQEQLELFPALGHDWEESEVTPATCTEKGEKKYTCKRCQKTKTEEIPATGHTKVIDEAVAPTCEKPGKTEGSHCSVCGEVYQEQKEIPATGHSWDEGKITKYPTATEAGERTYTCKSCGSTRTEAIDKDNSVRASGYNGSISWILYKDGKLVF